MRPFLPGPIPLCASIPPHAQPAEGALPFTLRWAQKLMVIADNTAIAQTNANHDSPLPADLNTVYELSLMTAPALEAAIEEGRPGQLHELHARDGFLGQGLDVNR